MATLVWVWVVAAAAAHLSGFFAGTWSCTSTPEPGACLITQMRSSARVASSEKPAPLSVRLVCSEVGTSFGVTSSRSKARVVYDATKPSEPVAQNDLKRTRRRTPAPVESVAVTIGGSRPASSNWPGKAISSFCSRCVHLSSPARASSTSPTHSSRKTSTLSRPQHGTSKESKISVTCCGRPAGYTFHWQNR